MMKLDATFAPLFGKIQASLGIGPVGGMEAFGGMGQQ